jgi:hypothetical protein
VILGESVGAAEVKDIFRKIDDDLRTFGFVPVVAGQGSYKWKPAPGRFFETTNLGIDGRRTHLMGMVVGPNPNRYRHPMYMDNYTYDVRDDGKICITGQILE